MTPIFAIHNRGFERIGSCVSSYSFGYITRKLEEYGYEVTGAPYLEKTSTSHHPLVPAKKVS